MSPHVFFQDILAKQQCKGLLTLVCKRHTWGAGKDGNFYCQHCGTRIHYSLVPRGLAWWAYLRRKEELRDNMRCN